MKRCWLGILVAALLMPAVCLAGEIGLSVGGEGEARGFQDNPVTVSLPEDGALTLSVTDGLQTCRVIVRDRPSRAGTASIVWDGLGENRERLPDGAYTLCASLVTADGRTLTAQTPVNIDRCRQSLLFALPSAGTLYLNGGEEWYVELRLVRPGKLVTEFCRGDDPAHPLAVKTKDMPGYRIQKYGWDGTLGGEALPPGDYVLRFYPEESPDQALDVRVTLAAGVKPVLPVTVTEVFMPRDGATDAEIWQAMMQPSAVIALKNTSHQQVLDQPSKLGRSLGTLHGQSQAVDVLEVRRDGWAKIGAWNHEDGSYIEGYVPLDRLVMVTPQTEYGLVLDKRSQTLTVYREGRKIGSMLVSTGLAAKNRLIRETAAGSFLTQEHMSDFSTNGYNYEYVLRYDGGNLMHQSAYRLNRGLRDFSEQAALLGGKASHGCVRVQPYAVDGGLNAYWLWTHIPRNTRLFVLDDPEQRAGAADAPDDGAAEPERPATPADLEEGESEVELTLGGDVVLGTREEWQQDADSLPAYLAKYGLAYPFRNLAAVFARDDLTLVNLECVLKSDAAGEDKSKDYRFRGLPSYAEALKLGSVELVNLANNHYVDYRAAGKEATRAALDAAGVAYSGYGYAYVLETGGHRIGFAGCRETEYKTDRTVIRREVARLKDAGCGAIVYSCHFGTEYSPAHNALQEAMAKAAVAAGADLVVGTHPHVVQGVAEMDGAVVLYSLGNLMFGGTNELVTSDGMLARVALRFSGDVYEGLTLSLLPVLTSGSAGSNDFSPVLASGDDAARIFAKVQSDSALLLTDAMYFPR